MSLPVAVRLATPTDAFEAGAVIAAAFGEQEVADLEVALAARADHVAFVAEIDGRIVGQ